MISAKEARELGRPNSLEERVEERVRERTIGGFSDAEFNFALPMALKSKLTSLGYKIRTPRNMKGYPVGVSWNG